ncbi:MAG: hypothetical protein LZF64_00030, partial [Nitrosomonas sp.]
MCAVEAGKRGRSV